MSEEKVIETIETYVAPVKKLCFSMPVLDEEGEPVIKRNPNTKEVFYTPKGVPETLERVIEFVNIINNPSKGFLCHYVVTEKTPKAIADYLKEAAVNRKHDIVTHETYLKTKNPAQYKEIQRRKALAAEYDAKLAEAREEGKAEGIKAASENEDTVQKLTDEVGKAAEAIATANTTIEAKDKELAASKQELTTAKGAETKANNTIEKLKAQVAKLESGAKS